VLAAAGGLAQAAVGGAVVAGVAAHGLNQAEVDPDFQAP